MKNLILFISVIIALISAGVAVNYNRSSASAEQSLNQERYSRMMAEEELKKSKDSVVVLQGEIARLKQTNTNLDRVLKQTQTLNVDLRARLDKAAEITEKLNQKLAEIGQL